MENIIDFERYKRIRDRINPEEISCMTCANTILDDFTLYPFCKSRFSEYYGNLLNSEISCDYYIRKEKR